MKNVKQVIRNINWIHSLLLCIWIRSFVTVHTIIVAVHQTCAPNFLAGNTSSELWISTFNRLNWCYDLMWVHFTPKRERPAATNVLLTMREDIEQKSNDHHPVLWHWRVGDWGTRTRLAAAQWPVSCHIQPPPLLLLRPCGLRQIGWSNTQSCLNWIVHQTGAIQVLAILVVPFICRIPNAFVRFPEHISKKFFCSWSPVSSSPTDTPLSKWELCRSCTCVWYRRSSTVVQLELRSERWDCVAHLC